MIKASANRMPHKHTWKYYVKRDKFFYILISLPILYYIIYKYLPMVGIVIAFQDYKPFLGNVFH